MSNVNQHTFNFQISNMYKFLRVINIVSQCTSFTKSEIKIKEIERAAPFFQSRQLLLSRETVTLLFVCKIKNSKSQIHSNVSKLIIWEFSEEIINNMYFL